MKDLDIVVIRHDLPEAGLEAGDLGTIVLTHAGGEGYEVEFINPEGHTVAVVSLPAHSLRPASAQEIADLHPVTA